MRKSALVAQKLAAARTTAHAPAPRSEEDVRQNKPHWTRTYLKRLAGLVRPARKVSVSPLDDARVAKAEAKRARKAEARRS